MWKIINNRKKNNANGGSKEKFKKICQLNYPKICCIYSVCFFETTYFKLMNS